MKKKLIIIGLVLLLVAGVAYARMNVVVVGGGVAAGGGGVTASDSFTGASGSGLVGWTHPMTPDATYDNFVIWTNRAVAKANRVGHAYWSDDTFSANHKSCVTLVVKSLEAGSYSGVTVRASTATGVNTNYGLWGINSGYELRKIVNGSPTVLLDSTNFDAHEAGDVVCLSVSGTNPAVLSVTINGGTAVTYNDSTSPITTGQPGIYGRRGAQSADVDDWSGEDI